MVTDGYSCPISLELTLSIFLSLPPSRTQTQAPFSLSVETAGQCYILQCLDPRCGRAEPQIPLSSEGGREGRCTSYSDSRLQLIIFIKEETGKLSKVPFNYKLLEFCGRNMIMVKSVVKKKKNVLKKIVRDEFHRMKSLGGQVPWKMVKLELDFKQCLH